MKAAALTLQTNRVYLSRMKDTNHTAIEVGHHLVYLWDMPLKQYMNQEIGNYSLNKIQVAYLTTCVVRGKLLIFCNLDFFLH